mmetsp:Transcript_98423/g.180078  ORF Transcript_98423/g.180078 Transcript_98423/m.180078 type:complete len:506 (-) Transcript_98423:100-1617(-)
MKSIFFGVNDDSAGSSHAHGRSSHEEEATSSRSVSQAEEEEEEEHYIMDRWGRMIRNPNPPAAKGRAQTLFGQKSVMMGHDKSLGPQMTTVGTNKSVWGQASTKKSIATGFSGHSLYGDAFAGLGLPFDARGSCASVEEDPLGLDCYQKKLKRRRLYCLIATLCGVVLLISVFLAADPAEELLMSFSSVHQAIFAMAVGHWINVLWEDFRCRHFLVQVMSSDHWLSFTSCLALQLFYFLHSCVSLFTFSFILATRTLGGLGVQCLLFEAPAVVLTHRELCISQVPMPDWLNEERTLRKVWRLTGLAFVLARGLAFLLWLCSWIPGIGAAMLESSLGESERTVYHVLAAFYFFFNLVEIGLMLNWSREDAERAEDVAAELLCQNLADNTHRNSGSEKQGIWDSKPRDSDDKPLGWTRSETMDMEACDSVRDFDDGSPSVRLAALQHDRTLPANKSALRPPSSSSARTEDTAHRKTHFQEAPANFGLPSGQKPSAKGSITWEEDSED